MLPGDPVVDSGLEDIAGGSGVPHAHALLHQPQCLQDILLLIAFWRPYGTLWYNSVTRISSLREKNCQLAAKCQKVQIMCVQTFCKVYKTVN